MERGVSIPFTTPMLLGARARPDDARGSLELIITNPSGGEGVYILPWNAIPQICAPTLHDRRLWHLLRNEYNLTPRTLRHAAESVALEGLAGRRAAMAVPEARRAAESRETRINFALLLDLIKQAEGANPAGPPPELDDPARVKIRGQRAVAHMAKRLGMTTEAIANGLEKMAKAFDGLGLPHDQDPAPSRRLVRDLTALVAEIDAWRQAIPAGQDAQAAGLVQRSMEITLKCADHALAEFDALIGDTIASLRAWHENPAQFAARTSRLDWLLDGWDMILGIWNAASSQERPAAIMEMALLAPILPLEVEGWHGIDPDWQRPQRSGRVVQEFEDWRSGRLIDMIARNENLTIAPARREFIAASIRKSAGPPFEEAAHKPRFSALPLPPPMRRPQPSKNQFAETRQLVHVLAAASDMALTQVVEILDRLPDRLEADRLLDAARPRLRQLRPLRPLKFARLLFLPLDGAITDSTKWQRGDARLPRSCLPALAEALRAAMGPAVQEIDAICAGKNFADIGAVDQAGRLAWAAAAHHAPGLKPNARWSSTGLRPEDFSALLQLATGVWRHAGPIWSTLQLSGWGPPQEAVRAALAPIAQEDPVAFSMALATLMQKATSPGMVALAAANLSPSAAIMADAAVDHWLGNARGSLPTEDLPQAATMAESFGRSLQDLENAPPTRNPNRAERLVGLRQEAEESCRVVYEQGLETEIMRALPLLQHAATPEQIMALEAQARALRRIELIGRRYGIAHGYDGAAKRIEKAIETTRRNLSPGGMTALDLARLAEILLGGEAALELLR